MAGIPRSTKEQIVIAAERLFAARGLDGVSLRQIGAAAGNGNNSAVQYHFGTKEQLVKAIFEYRQPQLDERRRLLVERRRPSDLRSLVECYMLPTLEQGEQQGSNYLSFVAMLQQHGDRALFDDVPPEYLERTRLFIEQVSRLLPAIPVVVRNHRIQQAMMFGVHAASDRERVRVHGGSVLPFAVHVADLLDGLVGFLEAPVSEATIASLVDADSGDAPLSALLV